MRKFRCRSVPEDFITVAALGATSVDVAIITGRSHERCHLTPDDARALAVELVRVADHIDQSKGN